MEQRIHIDLHVHTGRYSQCAENVVPAEVAGYAREAGLHGLVLTDHDVLWGGAERDLLQQASPDIRLFRGIECSTDSGHVVVIGLDDAAALHRGIDLTRACSVAHSQGGIVILAHPYRDGEAGDIPPEQIDAVEVGSTSFGREAASRAEALAERLAKPRVASSDAHALSRIGWAWTSFPYMPGDERELAAMIRRGLGVPVVPMPFSY